jgi:hypothetical protein
LQTIWKASIWTARPAYNYEKTPVMTRSTLFTVTGTLAVVAACYFAYARLSVTEQQQAESYKECSSCTARHRALIESKKIWAERSSDNQ